MATDRAVAAAVALVYTAAGRRFGRAEETLYKQVLAPVSDADLQQAVLELLRTETWDRRPPSPALVLDYVRALPPVEVPALPEDTGPPLEHPEALEWLARMRSGANLRLGGPRRVDPRAKAVDDLAERRRRPDGGTPPRKEAR